MPLDRAESIALTEAAFRIANERMARWEERHRDGVREVYFCECGSQPCRQRVSLTREQYQAVRADVRHFLVVPGHAIRDLETVVQSFASHDVVEKPSALMDLLVETDPRQTHSGKAARAARAIADEINREGTSRHGRAAKCTQRVRTAAAPDAPVMTSPADRASQHHQLGQPGLSPRRLKESHLYDWPCGQRSPRERFYADTRAQRHEATHSWGKRDRLRASAAERAREEALSDGQLDYRRALAQYGRAVVAYLAARKFSAPMTASSPLVTCPGPWTPLSVRRQPG